MYILIQNDKVTAFSENAFNGYTKKVALSYEEYSACPEKWVFNGNDFILNPEISKIREQEFKTLFFEIPNYGYYRKKPKGYGSAIESLNTVFNIVLVQGSLPANVLTFYNEPNFSVEKQCSEEWLIANSFKNNQMTKEEFSSFYASFVSAWNDEEHK